MKRLLIAMILVVSFCGLARAEEAMIEELQVNTTPHLNVSFSVANAFTEDITEAVKSGIPTSFTFIIKLHRIRKFWFDDHIETWKFKHTVKYDSLKEEYTVWLEEREAEEKVTDFDEMKLLMAGGSGVTLAPLPALKEGQTYTLKIMAELDTIELPFYLDNTLFIFVKLWDFETDWLIHRFEP